MRSLKTVLSRVNQLAERARNGRAGDLMERITARLLEARKRCAAGIPHPEPAWWSNPDDELRQRAGVGEPRRIVERLIGARRRLIERGFSYPGSENGA